MHAQLADMQQWIVVGQVAVAAVLGAMVGLERELARKPAGLRTHMLVAAASCLFVALMPVLMSRFGDDGSQSVVRIDPARLMQAVVTGIAFLGAGTIIVHRHSHRVEGLTTAASILLVSGIGCAVGVGAWVVGGAMTLITLFLLWGLGRVEGGLRRRRHDE